MLTNQGKKTVSLRLRKWPLTSLSRAFSFSFCSRRLSRWCTCISASASLRVLSWSSSVALAESPLLCSISSSFLMDSSRAFRVCFWVSIRSSISSSVLRSRNSSLACRSCSACSLWKFSSVSSATHGSPVLLLLSCWNSWFRSLWIRSSSWRAWMVICMCWVQTGNKTTSALLLREHKQSGIRGGRRQLPQLSDPRTEQTRNHVILFHTVCPICSVCHSVMPDSLWPHEL